MNNSPSLEERLDQLGRDLGDRPSLVPGVMQQVPPVGVCRRRQALITRWRAVTTLAAAACIIVVATVWLSRPATLYARALEALSKARTVHVTGWTTQLDRSWPLEEPQQHGDMEKHALDAWYWRANDDTPRSFQEAGPVIQTREGETFREYQTDVKLLYVAKVKSRDYLDHFATIAEYLRELDDKSVEKKELGTRVEDGKTLRGLTIVRHNRSEEYWFDVETDLPIRISRSQQKHNGTTIGYEMRFEYNRAIPKAIAEYTPPQTDNIRYGSGHSDVQLAWRRHVQDIGLRLKEQQFDQRVAILPRDGHETFAHQWPLSTPDGKYSVIPLDLDQHFPLTVKNFVNRRVAAEDGDRAFETWRIPENLQDIEIPCADLVYAQGTPWQEWVQYVLHQNSLEYVDAVEDHTYWIAHHDGRELKPWRMVEPPVPYLVEGGVVQRGVVRPGIGQQLYPATMHGLFEHFNRNQNVNFTADHPIIVDETGLAQPPDWDREQHPSRSEYREHVLEKFFVATDSPYFAGKVSRKMARDWFQTEFGVTFTEQQRPLTIHIVRRKN